MAQAVLQLNIQSHWDDTKRIHVIGNITDTVEAGTYLTGGLPLDLSNDLIKGTQLLVARVTAPGALYVVTDTDQNPPESQGQGINAGIPANDCLLNLYSAPGTEFAEDALPDAVIGFYGIYSKLI
jgi:hypothetical protein